MNPSSSTSAPMNSNHDHERPRLSASLVTDEMTVDDGKIYRESTMKCSSSSSSSSSKDDDKDDEETGRRTPDIDHCDDDNHDNQHPTVNMKTASTRKEKDEDNNSSKNNNDDNKLSFHMAVIILTTFSTAGSIIAMPWAFGQLGYVLGPLLLIAVFGSTLWFYFFLLSVADDASAATAATPTVCRTLGDVGQELAGPFGRNLFTTLQILNVIFYMPVALETVGFSIEYVVNGNCIGYWNILTFVVLYALIQFTQCWEHVSWIGYITFAMAIAKGFAFLPYAYVEYQDEAVQLVDYEPAQAFGNPSPTWHDLSIAVSTLYFAFAPVFVLIEVRSDMKNPRDCKKALATSAMIQFAVYIVGGVTCTALWGWNVADPITLQIPRSWVGYLLNVFVIVAVALDFAIAGKIANDFLLIKYFPTQWSIDPTLWQQLVYTAPTSVFSIAMALAVPNFSTMIGILTGITIIGSNTWMVTLAWEWGKRKYSSKPIWMWLGCINGTLMMLWILAGSFYEVITADYSPGFFCTGS